MTKNDGSSRVSRRRGTKVEARKRARGLTRGAVARGQRASYTPVFGTKLHKAVEGLADVVASTEMEGGKPSKRAIGLASDVLHGTKTGDEAVAEYLDAEDTQLFIYRVTNVKTKKDFMCSARDHIDAIDAAMKHGLARKSANLVTEVV